MSRTHSIRLGGHSFLPHISGALYCEALATLLVADLHLEQGAALARRGIAVPPYDTLATLSALEQVMAETAPARLILLGDSFHDAVGHDHLDEGQLQRIRSLTARVETVWVSGNHDPAPKHHLGGACVDHLQVDGITLRHEPSRRPSGREIAGHLHPGAGIVQRGHMVRGKCFISDETRIILPAFGAYTGALPVTSRAFHGLFETEKASIVMLAREKLYRFPLSRVV